MCRKREIFTNRDSKTQKMENWKFFSAGVLLGLFVNSIILNSLIFVFSVYTVIVFIIRMVISYSLMNLHVMASRILVGNEDVLLNRELKIYYNAFYNKVIVRRNILTKMTTNNDEIIKSLEELFNKFALFDIFCHIVPLEIIFR